VITATSAPDHSTIARLGRPNEQALADFLGVRGKL